MSKRTMYAVSIRYPRKAGEEFNLEHWAQVHMPMGLAIFERTNALAPRRVMIQHSTCGMTGAPGSTDAYATVWLIFDTRAGLDGFMRLHNDPDASRPLAEDFANYAPVPPHIALGEVWEFDDIDALLSRGRALM